MHVSESKAYMVAERTRSGLVKTAADRRENVENWKIQLDVLVSILLHIGLNFPLLW